MLRRAISTSEVIADTDIPYSLTERLLHAGQCGKHSEHENIKCGTRQKTVGEAVITKFLIRRANQRVRPAIAYTGNLARVDPKSTEKGHSLSFNKTSDGRNEVKRGQSTPAAVMTAGGQASGLSPESLAP